MQVFTRQRGLTDSVGFWTWRNRKKLLRYWGHLRNGRHEPVVQALRYRIESRRRIEWHLREYDIKQLPHS